MGSHSRELHAIDIGIIIVSVLMVFMIGAWASYRRKKATTDEYFLSERSLSWWVVGASLFASNIGAEHFVGQSGAAAAHGVVVALWEWSACMFIMLLGFVTGPVYIRCRVSTVPEYLEMRFNRTVRLLVVVCTMVVYGGNKIGGCLYAGAIFFEVVFDWPMYVTIPLILISTGLYTIGGGLDAVVYTDCVQTLIFVVGGIAAAIISLREVGGLPGLYDSAAELIADQPDYTSTYRPPESKTYATTGMLTGAVLGSTWYWAVDQEMVQRVLGAKSKGHAQAGVVFASLLKLLPPFMIIFPGMVARILYEKCQAGQGYVGWCEARLDKTGHSDKAYAYLVLNIMPVGMVGIITAAVIAAMMSSLSSIFNSMATVLTFDAYKLYYPDATEEESVSFGRMACAAMTVLGICWVPVIRNMEGEVYVIIQSITAAFAPTLATITILGMCCKRINGSGALVGMAFGILFGTTRLVLSFAYKGTCKGSQSQTAGPPFACWDFNHFAALLGVCVAFVTAAASECFPLPTQRQTGKPMLMYEEPLQTDETEDLIYKGEDSSTPRSDDAPTMPMTEADGEGVQESNPTADVTVTAKEDDSPDVGEGNDNAEQQDDSGAPRLAKEAGLPEGWHKAPSDFAESSFIYTAPDGTQFAHADDAFGYVNKGSTKKAKHGEGPDQDDGMMNKTARDMASAAAGVDADGCDSAIMHNIQLCFGLGIVGVSWFLMVGFGTNMYGTL